MRNFHPIVQSYFVVRLCDTNLIRCCVPVPRKNIQGKIMMIQYFVSNGLTLACNVAHDEYATVLAYSPLDDSYYPLYNYDPAIKFIPTPKR